MTLADSQQLRQVESFLSCARNVAPAEDQPIGSHHATVKPVHDAAASNATNHADVRTVDLRHNVADEKLWQPCCVRDLNDLFAHTHSNVLPVGAPAAPGIRGINICYVSSELSLYPSKYGALSAQVVSNYERLVPTREQLSDSNPYKSRTSRLHSEAAR